MGIFHLFPTMFIKIYLTMLKMFRFPLRNLPAALACHSRTVPVMRPVTLSIIRRPGDNRVMTIPRGSLMICPA